MRIAIVAPSDTSAPEGGVRDYSEHLAAELRRRGLLVDVLDLRIGLGVRARGIRDRWREIANRDWTIMQYTHLAWSKRGFPIGALAIAAALRLSSTKLAVVIHDPLPFGGSRARDRVRALTQVTVMRSLALLAHRTIVTVNPAVLSWAPTRMRARLRLVAVGSNVGFADWVGQERSSPTVVVFGVTENSVAEATRIASVMTAANRSVGDLELRVVGRGAPQSSAVLRNQLMGSGVRLDVRGILSADAVASCVADADVLLFLRGGASSRRGTLAAAIACGTPIVAEWGPETSSPITEAGIDLVPMGDDTAASAAIVRAIQDRTWRDELSARSREAYAQWFSWESIGTRILEALR